MFSYEEALAKSVEYFSGDELAAKVFVDKYALRDNQGNILEDTPDAMHRRMAKELARIESKKFSEPLSEQEIYTAFKGFVRILPQGSICYGLGNYHQIISLSNCFVIESPGDSFGHIHRSDEQLSQLSKRRCGVGVSLDKIRPAGAPTQNSSRTSTGIVPFCERFSNSIREVGQCIAKGQRVLTKRGLVEIQNVLKNVDEVWTKEGWVRVTNVFSNGVKQTFRTTSSFGFEILTTEDHIFQSFNSNGLTEERLADLSIGDGITLLPGTNTEFANKPLQIYEYEKHPHNNSNRLNENIKLPTLLNSDLAYFLGYCYGNGYIEKANHEIGNGLSISTPNEYPLIQERITNLFKTIFGIKPQVNPGDGECKNIECYSTLIIEHLFKNGVLKNKADSLLLPERIINANSTTQLDFICGYFDADGDVAKGKGGYRMRSVCPEFLKQIQVILCANGVISKFSTSREATGNWKKLYQLTIVGWENQRRFRSLATASIKVGLFPFETKQDKSQTPYTAKSLGLKRGGVGNYIPDKGYVSMRTVRRAINDGLMTEINILAQDSIIGYELGPIINTYDLELESEHLFWCEGFYVHNSGRRGALMECVSVHHPDILEFVRMKMDETKVNGANVSVKLTDEFLNAVEDDEEYELRWPVDSASPKISKKISAKEVWKEIIRCAWTRAEPGLLFWDNIIRESPADCYGEEGFRTEGTNPCAELPLSQLDSCRLLLLNLISYVSRPFTKNAKFEFKLFFEDVKLAQRLMDDIVDAELECIDRILAKIEDDPEPANIKATEKLMWLQARKSCENGRRTGTGITALGDTIAALGIKYGTKESIKIAEEIYKCLKLGAYASSVEMAKEIGPFNVWNYDNERDNPFLNRLKDDRIEGVVDGRDIYALMKEYGRRNIALLTTAPAGTISILAQLAINLYGTTSGIEPMFMTSYTRRKKITHTDANVKVDYVDKLGDKWQEFKVYAAGPREWMKANHTDSLDDSPYAGACAEEIDWVNRVKLQAAAQKHCDHSISSTINLPESVTQEEVSTIYTAAWKQGLKGITVYRKNCRAGVLIENKTEEKVVEKRPKEVPCDVHHIVVKGKSYYVLVGILNDRPYEVFAGRNGMLRKKIETGKIVRVKKGYYKALFDDDDIIISPLGSACDEHEESITRLTSACLQSGGDILVIVEHLEKVNGELQSFAKAIARALKGYIKDGTKIIDEICPECGQESLIRQSGCVQCSNQDCLWSKC